MCKNVMASLILACLGGIAVGQSGEYSRKSVTFLDAVIIASPEARELSLNQIDHISKTVKEKVQLSRFDFNPIPENSPLMQSFLGQVKNQGDMSLDDIAVILNTTFVQQIVAMMDEYAEQRAALLVDEATRMSFITTKAKDLGITAENLEQVFNSGFIYLPFINGYFQTVDSEKKDDITTYTVTVNISGGIFWFKINYTDGKTSVVPVVKNESKSIGFAVKKNFNDAESAAFTAAVQNYARNLENATKDYDEFKLSTSIAELDGSTVGFRMGKREGLRIDDRFIVGEYVQNASGKPEFKEDGFLRVRDIVDNRNGSSDLSHGYGVIVGDWGEGMSLVEHPRLNLDIYGLLGSLPLSTNSQEYTVEGGAAIGAEIAYNLSMFTQKSHWYAVLGAMIGGATIADSWTNDEIYNSVSRLLVSASVMKRAQWRRFDAFGQLGFAYQQISGNYETGGYEYTERNDNYGLLMGLGLNYTLNIDLTVGVRYSLYNGESDEWTRYNSENEEIGEFTEPILDYSGGAIAFQIMYAPPSLGFDPASAIGNLVP